MVTKTKKSVQEASLEQVQESIEAGHTKEGFNAAEFILNGAVVLPTTVEDVFLDQAAAYEITQLDIQLAALDSNPEYKSVAGVPTELKQPLGERRQELAERLYNTRLVLHFKGLSPARAHVIDKNRIQKFKSNESLVDQSVWLTVERLRFSITKIEVPSTEEEQAGPLSHEDMHDFFMGLPLTEQSKVQNIMEVLSFGVELSDRRGDAGFLSGGTDMADE